MSDKVFNLLGIAKKSGNVIYGQETVVKKMSKGQVFLLILAEDSSINTKDYYDKKNYKHKIPLVKLGDKERLGASVGSSPKAALAITDEGFANTIINSIGSSKEVH